MPLIKAPAAPRSQGWATAGYRYGPNAYETTVPELIEEMRAALDADVRACRSCQTAEGMAPRHFTGYVKPGYAFTYHCRSWSRWFNPQTREMEGHAHCTCDGCF